MALIWLFFLFKCNFSSFFLIILGNEHDNRGARPSTSRGGGSYPDRFNKKVTFKANNRGGPNHFRKSWDNKTELVREQLDNAHISANPNRNVPHRNNSGRRYIVDYYF